MKRFFPHAICSGLTVMAMLMLWSAPFASARERRAEPAYDEQGWRLAVPGWNYTFPTDHGTHDEFQTEWWYFTGNLREVGSGRRFGYQLTFFRQGITPPAQFAREAAERPDHPLSAWRLRNLYFAHFALADVEGKKFEFAERLSRGTLGLAFYSQNQFWVQIGDWFARAFPPLRQDARPRMEERFELQAARGMRRSIWSARGPSPLSSTGAGA
ncbi:carotenoid 1,2-hydratase [Oscillatoria laete-virens NRMC-F 0139]|nr:carotenoid 1,2-hydratase [Oscillatoria laete-virens]MDL5053953.1 carotenoid 1,2-hydratase [Oscillatoria laete-virens NRMC-F 0139]